MKRKQRNQTETSTAEQKCVISCLFRHYRTNAHVMIFDICSRLAVCSTPNCATLFSPAESRPRPGRESCFCVLESIQHGLDPNKTRGDVYRTHSHTVYHNLKTSKATHVLITHFRASWLPLIGLFWSFNFLWRSFMRKFFTGSRLSLCCCGFLTS